METTTNAAYIHVTKLGLSNRACNCLQRNRIMTLEQFMELTETDISKMRNAGRQTVEEIIRRQEEIRNGGIENEPTEELTYSQWIRSAEGKSRCVEYTKEHDMLLSDMELSVRSYNGLRFAGYTYFSEIVCMTISELKEVPNLGKKSVDEIYDITSKYLADNEDNICPATAENLTESETKKDTQLRAKDVARLIEYKDKVLEYVKEHDETLETLGISQRIYNSLSKAGITKLSDFILMPSSKIGALASMGQNSVVELISVIERYFDFHNDSILIACYPDYRPELSYEYVSNHILMLYKNSPFKGYSIEDYIRLFPVKITEEDICPVIGKMISNQLLEYVDYRCYRKHTSIVSFLEEHLVDENDDRSKALLMRLKGLTLEEIGRELGVTRERARQLTVKQAQKVKNLYISLTGEHIFDEDYYEYLYTEYLIDRGEWNRILATPVTVYNYLDMTYEKGKRDKAEILEDINVSEGIKLRFRLQFDSKSIVIDGHRIKKVRSEVENYVIRQLCEEDITFTDFVEQYNAYLESHFVPYDEDIYYTEGILRSRENRIGDSRIILWKLGRKFRYYDIDGRDYTELLNTLGLEDYHNIRISTQKFIEAYPELMAQYDIRDCYELHNLLNKILNMADYDEIDMRRMPMIQFGEVDLFKLYEDIITYFSPISESDLIDYIHQEFGIDKISLTASPEMTKIRNLYAKDGVYAIESKPMSDSSKERLKLALAKDIYTLDELKVLYKSIIPDADTDEISQFNLASLDYYIRSGFVLKGFSNLNSYIRYALLKEELFDITPYKRMFNGTQAFYIVLQDLKRNFEIFEYEPNQYISFSRIEKMGVSKSDICAYCDMVDSYIPNGGHFTIKSLEEYDITTPLDKLGFEHYFYERILAVDDRFSSNTLSGTHVYYKSKTRVSAVNFTQSVMENENCIDSIDIYDLMYIYREKYGITFEDKWDLLTKLKESEFYYDTVMEKLYRDKEVYYRELDKE